MKIARLGHGCETAQRRCANGSAAAIPATEPRPRPAMMAPWLPAANNSPSSTPPPASPTALPSRPVPPHLPAADNRGRAHRAAHGPALLRALVRASDAGGSAPSRWWPRPCGPRAVPSAIGRARLCAPTASPRSPTSTACWPAPAAALPSGASSAPSATGCCWPPSVTRSRPTVRPQAPSCSPRKCGAS